MCADTPEYKDTLNLPKTDFPMCAGLPKRDLMVSRQHRMVARSGIVKRICGAMAVLVAAIRLTELPGVHVDEGVSQVEYFHLVFEKHQIVYAEGAPSESFLLNADTVKHFDAVSGRAHRQDANRHQTGSLAPLPPGTYSVGDVEPLGPTDPAELGPLWIGIEPLFATGRGHLGIHLDPSANQNANSGTLGCIGLVNPEAMAELAELIQEEQVRTLRVMN